MQVCPSIWDIPGRLQLLHNLKRDHEEDEEAEGDPEPTWLAPVYRLQVPAGKQTFQTTHCITWRKKYIRHKAEGKETSRLPRDIHQKLVVFCLFFIYFYLALRSFSMGGRGVETAITNGHQQLCLSSGA